MTTRHEHTSKALRYGTRSQGISQTTHGTHTLVSFFLLNANPNLKPNLTPFYNPGPWILLCDIPYHVWPQHQVIPTIREGLVDYSQKKHTWLSLKKSFGSVLVKCRVVSLASLAVV